MNQAELRDIFPGIFSSSEAISLPALPSLYSYEIPGGLEQGRKAPSPVYRRACTARLLPPLREREVVSRGVPGAPNHLYAAAAPSIFTYILFRYCEFSKVSFELCGRIP